jgi:HlyD family secretion protein
MAASRRRLLWLIPITALCAGAVLFARTRGKAAEFTLGTVDRGDVVEVVGATGTLEAVTTVQVGSQVSGTIDKLYADFNSQVKQGQVIARLDPSILEARVGQADASVLAARANVDRARATVEDTRQKYERAKELAAQKLIAETDLETAKSNYDGAVAQLKSNQAAESQAIANLNQAKVDLSHSVITTPIDGVVISRSVDVGQTVAASFTAPVLFVIANDLRKMRVNASIDEADVGRVREGQDVLFHVDAFPERDFWGRVEQVRLNPTTVSNVVTYNAIVAVDNEQLLLRPGMTATVSVQVRKAANTLRLPAAALRFRPEGYERPTGAAGRSAAQGPGAGAAASPASAQRTGGSAAAETTAGGDSGRRGGPAAGGRPGDGRRTPTGGGGPAAVAGGAGRPRHTTVFVPGVDGKPRPAEVTVGISDGQYVEVREGLQEGSTVITGTEIPGAPARAAGPRAGASPSTNPFSPQFQRRQR